MSQNQEKVDELSSKIWDFVYSWWRKEKDITIQEAFEIQIAALSTCFTQALINLSEYSDFTRQDYIQAVDKLLKMTKEDMLKEDITSTFE
ncbi:MAG: hypothetical protein K9L86_01655 [Candidatus Omnitrophica bacterium]|nr:hypothetical protein [Candidatus Omnitrophota bacterium]